MFFFERESDELTIRLRAANEELRKLRRKVHWSEISEPESHAAAIVSNNALD